LVARKVRDIYGNWVWETDDGNSSTQNKEPETQRNKQEQKPDTQEVRIQLEWRDWIALTLAALQTILLPFVVIIVLLLTLAIVFAH
jgi:hypothetical protein